MHTLDCPCQSQKTYAQCCQRWHQGEHHLKAPDAKQLMRSRYTAFVFDLTDYLLATWHPSTRPLQLDPNPKGTQWLGLQIRQHQIQNDTQQTVEFVARSRLHGRATHLHEISQFVRQEGQWFYVDGVFKD